jgi:hypothetical protein
MSDKPLFRDTDAQEAVYAPQQLPADSEQARVVADDDADRDQAGTDEDVGVPAAGAGLLGMTGGGVSGAIAGGTPSTQGPSVGAAAPEDETAGDHPV